MVANENSVRYRRLSTKNESDTGSASKPTPKTAKFKPRTQQMPLQNLFKSQRYWARFVIILAVVIIIYVSSLNTKERKFARQREVLPYRFQPLRCQNQDSENVKGCTPKTCGRYVSDNLIGEEELGRLLKFAKSAFQELNSDDSSSATFDLITRRISNGDVDTVVAADSEQYKNIFSHDHLLAFKLAKSKVLQSLVERFEINRANVHLAAPIYFSKLTNMTHVDYSEKQVVREAHPSAFYTTTIYLGDFGKDFKGGRMVFIDDPSTNKSISTVEPRVGRIMGFTAGAENIHYLERVSRGAQYTLTMQFTCQESESISAHDPATKIGY